jgi:hypothetical protein
LSAASAFKPGAPTKQVEDQTGVALDKRSHVRVQVHDSRGCSAHVLGGDYAVVDLRLARG